MIRTMAGRTGTAKMDAGLLFSPLPLALASCRSLLFFFFIYGDRLCSFLFKFCSTLLSDVSSPSSVEKAFRSEATGISSPCLVGMETAFLPHYSLNVSQR